jgi:undecaprenyl-diphosphatase
LLGVRIVGSRVLARLGTREAGTLAALLIAAGGLWVFVELADEVMEGESASVDERLLLMLRSPDDSSDPLGPAWVEELARDATGVGGAGFLTFLTLASAGFLALQRRKQLAVYLLAAVAGGTLVSTLLKLGFDRPRPDLVPHGSLVYTSSFPSGHSMLSAVTFLTLGALLASGQTNIRIRVYLIGLATFLAIVVGVSRVYLGVHWPTDVLAGWTAGATWTLLCWAFAERLRRRGVVE